MAPSAKNDIWLAAGVRTPFAKVDGVLSGADALALSVPVARHMIDRLGGGRLDVMVWGNVVPNLTWSNIAREILMEAGVDPSVPAFSTVMACSTSMMGVFEAAGLLDGAARNLALVGGVDSLSQVQSAWHAAVELAAPVPDRALSSEKPPPRIDLRCRTVRLYIPAVSNRNHRHEHGREYRITARTGRLRARRRPARASKAISAFAAWTRFLRRLVIPSVMSAATHSTPRPSWRSCAARAAFDRTRGKGLTAGNSSPLTDGAAAIGSPPAAVLRGCRRRRRACGDRLGARAVDFRVEGLLMGPPMRSAAAGPPASL